MPALRSVAGTAVAVMTLSSFLTGAGFLPQLAALPGACAWLAGLILVFGLNRFQITQALIMSGIGLAGISVAIIAGDYSWWATLEKGNHPMLAMLASVSFLRLITEPGVAHSAALPRGPRAVVQTLLATHLFGAVINISAPVVIGERIAQNERLSRLQSQAISRAFVAASMWSPFFIAMAIILQLLPKAQFAVISAAGFIASGCFMAWNFWHLPRDPEAHAFIGYPLRVQALWAPVLLSTCVLGGHWLLPQISVLTLIDGAALGVVLATLPLVRGRAAPQVFVTHLRERLPGMGSEIAMFLGAAVMSAGIEAAVRHGDIALSPAHLDASGAAVLLAGLVVLGIVGVHPVAAISALSSIWHFNDLDGNLLGIVFLLVWGLSLVASPFSGTSLVFQTRFGLGSMDLLRWNLGYVAMGYCVGVGVLFGYQWWANAG